MIIKLILALNFIFIMAAALSADAMTITKKITKKIQPPPATGFSGSASIARYGSMIDHQDGTRFDSLDTTASFAYTFLEKYKLSSLFYYSYNLKKEDGDWDDLSLSFSRQPMTLYSRLQVSPALLGTVPMSKDSTIRQELKGGIGTGLRFSFLPNTFVGGLDFKFSLSLFRNFFAAETATDGKTNSEYSSVQKATAIYAYKKLNSSITFIHLNSLTYQNNIKESFMHFTELGYDFTPAFSATIGHANIGSALKPNGQDSNILFINENTSLLYVSSRLNF